jgi:hypothetical protein
LSTGTPDASGTPDATPAATGGKPGGKYWAITAAIAVVLGVAGFFIGSAVKQSDYNKGKPGYNKIYAEGNAAGQASGNAAGKAAGQKLGVAQGLQVGKKAGEIAGQKAGEAAGQKAGYSAGYTAGVQKGSLATLGGLTGWNTNVPYVVELDPSPVAGVPYQIYSRTLMKADVSYYLCPNGTTVCSNPLVK